MIEYFDTASDIDYEETCGLNVKVGCHYNRLFSFEFNFDYLPGFERSKSDRYLYSSSVLDITTYMLAAKLTPDINSGSFIPFIVGGLGIMETNYKDSFGRGSYSESDPCAKLGLGVDFFRFETLSIGVEANYVWGLGAGALDEISYINSTFGVAYHF